MTTAPLAPAPVTRATLDNNLDNTVDPVLPFRGVSNLDRLEVGG